MDSPRAGHNLDIALALAAGPSAWASDPPGAVDWAATSVATSALAFVTVETGFRYLTQPFPWPGRVLAVAGLVTGATLIVLPELMRLRAPAREWQPPGRYRTLLAIRFVGMVTLVGLWSGIYRGSQVFLGWPLGVAAGADVTLTLRALGFRMRPLTFWRTFLTSEIHLGGLAALLGLAAVGLIDPSDAFRLLLAAHMALAAATGTLALLSRASQAEDTRITDAEDRTVSTMRRRLAHWIHDDVCSSIGVLKMQIQTGTVDSHHIGQALEELDHDLRLRQLDEVMASGRVQLAEILQPFVRKAQALGIDVVETPSFETAGYELSGDAAWCSRRVISVAVSNAINARTPWLAVRAFRDAGGRLILEVEDGAGGFATDDLPLGRGLHMLMQELDDRLTLTATHTGTLVRARVEGPEAAR